MNKVKLTVIILTKNEELNIRNALVNVKDWAAEVFVLDSGSTDKTKDIVHELDVPFFYRKFDNFANQRTHAIRNLPSKTDWILFLDADEIISNELKHEITNELKQPLHDGYYIKYRFYFLGKWIRFGGYYGTEILRLFKRNKGVISRDMNEHISINGSVGFFKYDIIHNDMKELSEWISKHNIYSNYEAEELIKFKMQKSNDEFANLFGTQPQRKRWIREKIWNNLLPPLIRPFIYYFYRYFLRLGFLDGKQGFIFHFLHGLWFPLLIDVKYLEIKRKKCAEY